MFGVSGESVVAHGAPDFLASPHRFHQAVILSMTLPFQHFVQPSLQPTVGETGLDTATYESLLDSAAPAVANIRSDLAAGELPCFGLASRRDDLEALMPVADRIRGRYRHCVVLGTGGSSLGAQTLLALAAPEDRARLILPDNLDGRGFAELLAGLDPETTFFLSVSKSGGTTETLAQTLVVLDWLRTRLSAGAIPGHLMAIAEPGDNALRRLCDAHGVEVLEHDPKVGGRFSVLSLVGLLPAMIAGLDAHAVRSGAAQLFESLLTEDAPPPVAGAAVAVGLADRRGRGQQVIMPYAGSLERLSMWHRQLWAESLGKDGRGLTPVAALGPVDQHSQLQLWLDGPADKSFTVITVAEPEPGPVIAPDLVTDPALAYLSGQSLGAIVQTQARATMETLVAAGHPVRMIRLPRLDEKALGGLLMHFMLETVIAAHLLGVDPFGQPAVETSKRLTRDYLKGTAS
jgi:glucose-6-phosphate isomerase